MALNYRRRNDLLALFIRDCADDTDVNHNDYSSKVARFTMSKYGYVFDRAQSRDSFVWAGMPSGTARGLLAYGMNESYNGDTIQHTKTPEGEVVLHCTVTAAPSIGHINRIDTRHNLGGYLTVAATDGTSVPTAAYSRLTFTPYYTRGELPRTAVNPNVTSEVANALDIAVQGTTTEFYSWQNNQQTITQGEYYVTPCLATFCSINTLPSGRAIFLNYIMRRIPYAVYGTYTTTAQAGGVYRGYDCNIYALKGHEKEVISAFAGMFGVPWTLSAAEARNTPVDDFSDYVPDGQPDDPDDGGDGDGDNEDDYIPDGEPDIDPAIGCSRYVLTPNQTDVFTREIWTETFINDLWRLFENPADAIISLAIFPINITAGTPAPIKIGNVQLDAIGAPLTNSIARYTMGTYTISEYYGDFNDYANTKIDLYLPYIGFKSIEPTAVVGKAITIDYVVDYSDNSVMATIRADGAFVDTARGMIGTTIPLSSTNANERLRALMSNTIGTVASVATTVANFAVGNVAGGVAGVVSSVGSAAKTAVDNKSIISSSGNVQGLSAWYAPQCVFARISRPIELTPSTYYTMMGGASAHGGTVGTFSGYTEFSTVRLNTSATSGEYNEIIRLLQGGVYL